MAHPNAAARFYGAFYRLTCLNRAGLQSASCSSARRGHAMARNAASRFTTRQMRIRCSSNSTAPKDSPASINLKQAPDTANIDLLPDLSSHMRRIMRRIPHPVVVITATAPAADDSPLEDSFRGMTVSSFNTVTLSPKPLVSFNVRKPSSTYEALISSGGFLAHFLRSSADGAQICDAFARGHKTHGDAFQMLVSEHPDVVKVFAGSGTDGAPLLAGQGVLNVLRCKVLPGKEIEVGDHVVLVGEVAGIVTVPGSKQSSPETLGLVYCDQAYRRVGEEIGAEDPVPRGEDAAKDDGPVQRTIGMHVRRGDEHLSS